MTLEDLEHIFKPQFEEGTTKLYFMLVDQVGSMTGKQTITMMREDVDKVANLLPMLDSFQYTGSVGKMPRFVK